MKINIVMKSLKHQTLTMTEKTLRFGITKITIIILMKTEQSKHLKQRKKQKII